MIRRREMKRVIVTDLTALVFLSIETAGFREKLCEKERNCVMRNKLERALEVFENEERRGSRRMIGMTRNSGVWDRRAGKYL